jgi:hypothetical protein
MGRILMLIITLGVTSFVAYNVVHKQGASADEASAPKQQLDNVREAAKRIEAEQERRAQEALQHGHQAEAH